MAGPARRRVTEGSPVQGDDPALRQAQAAMIEAGFHPVRQTGLVDVLRRLIWPLIRPFHFHTLDRLAVADTAVVQLQAEIGRLEAAVGHLSAQTMDADRLQAAEARIDKSEARMDGSEAMMGRSEARMERSETRLDRSEARMDVAAGGIERLEIGADEQQRRVERLESNVADRDDLARLVVLHARFRADLLDIASRHVELEERCAAALGRAEAIRDRLARPDAEAAAPTAG